MSTYLGIPRPSAFILELKEQLFVEIAVGIGKISVFQESDVFGLVWEVTPGSSQEILLSL